MCCELLPLLLVRFNSTRRHFREPNFDDVSLDKKVAENAVSVRMRVTSLAAHEHLSQ